MRRRFHISVRPGEPFEDAPDYRSLLKGGWRLLSVVRRPGTDTYAVTMQRTVGPSQALAGPSQVHASTLA